MQTKQVTKAVIPAAGYGTRFLPETKAIAKEMFPIIDTPTIELIVKEAYNSGITQFLVIVSANKNAIIDYFDRNLELERILLSKGMMKEYELITELPNKINIFFVRQKEQLGLGHAVLQAKTFVGDEPFALLLGDDVYHAKKRPAIKQLIDTYNEKQASIIGTLKVDIEDVSKYGICAFENPNSKDRLNRLVDVVEKPKVSEAPSQMAIGGRYILTPKIFKYLETQTPGAKGEIQLTDSIRRLMQEEKVYSYEIEANRYDIGSRIGYIEAMIDYGLERPDLKNQIIELINEKYQKINNK